MQTPEPLFPFSFRKFLFIFTPFFILADSQYEKASRTQNLNKKKNTSILSIRIFLLLLINTLSMYMPACACNNYFLWHIFFVHNENTFFIHSCWKTLPPRRPKASFDKTTNHNEILTDKSTSWAQRVRDLYVGFFPFGNRQIICIYINIYVDILYLLVNIDLCVLV